MDELYQNRIILRESVETPASEVSVYQRIRDTAWIPFLYFATEIMRARCHQRAPSAYQTLFHQPTRHRLPFSALAHAL